MISKGRKQRSPAVVVYGPDGVGKTGFGAFTPNPIFIEAERGSDAYDVDRFDPSPKSFDEIIKHTEYLLNNEHSYQTLIYDSLDWIESLLHKKIIAQYSAKNIAAAAGGFGRGYLEAADRFRDLIELVDKLRDDKKMNVIFICHAQSKTFNDPEHQATYERFGLKLDDRANAVFREYVDAVLFMNYQVFVKTEDGNAKGQAYGTGDRLIHVERKPGFDAKNRYGLHEPINYIERQGWNDFFSQIKSVNTEPSEVILSRIASLLEFVPKDTLPKVHETIALAGNDSVKLMTIEKRLNEIAKMEREIKK